MKTARNNEITKNIGALRTQGATVRHPLAERAGNPWVYQYAVGPCPMMHTISSDTTLVVDIPP